MPIYINQVDQSNKFWQYDVNENMVKIKWGRIGGSSQEQTKQFPTTSQLDNFISKKVSEKLAKGYIISDKDKLNKEVKTAQDLGTQYKIMELHWVSMGVGKLTKLPEYNPSQYVLARVMNSWSKEYKDILISKNSSGYLDNYNDFQFKNFRILSDNFIDAIKKYIKSLNIKITEMITMFGDLGVRKLDIEGDFKLPDVQLQLVSEQVITTMKTMGTRYLEL